MATRLKVDLDHLGELFSSLGTLSTRLNGSSDEVDVFGSFLGHDDLLKAMHEWADNWSWYRQDLVGRLEVLSKAAGDARDTFVTVDDELASALRPSTS